MRKSDFYLCKDLDSLISILVVHFFHRVMSQISYPKFMATVVCFAVYVGLSPTRSDMSCVKRFPTDSDTNELEISDLG